MIQFIDTHTHLDGEEFQADLEDVIQRARESGAVRLFIPGINASSVDSIKSLCRKYPNYCEGMLGLHPEDVKSDYREVLDSMHQTLLHDLASQDSIKWIAIGEIGLDYYWSREFESEQLEAFETQVQWAADLHLPLMIHCRKAQHEMVSIIRKYQAKLSGGVFHCFTGNAIEAKELLQFSNFCLGIGGVLTFKKSKLPETLAEAVPLNRIVLETDAPYMAPVPHRGERNESAFVIDIINKLAEVYNTTPEEVASITTDTATRLFLN